MKGIFDILVVGGGHAGIEAAWIASHFNLRVGMITLPGVPIASAPCNPAIGGVGKGQVVREIDAMGGLMGFLADKASIQFRILNESKGYAVQSTRVQIDKEVYAQIAEETLSGEKNLHILRHKVVKVTKFKELFQVFTEDGKVFQASKLVVTMGTFLNGKLHAGKWQQAGGRMGHPNSSKAVEIFSGIKTCPRPFKTGTPPRLDKRSLDFSAFVEQKSDPAGETFHHKHHQFERFLPQVSCFLTKTNKKTLEIIRENKSRSPLYNGQIAGIGPRYCPSIEDKAFRYPDRHEHHIFIEPEGLNTQSIYPNGISTSLPLDIQKSFVRTIRGLERAEICVPGHAVEYDVVDTSQLKASLACREIKGLYFAGQVNGTSGYEEAAGQGLVAGINAALEFLGREPLVFRREDSYIGVMVEDLVGRVRDEPYRLFTARSENRLFIREDNSILRMAPYRQRLGLDREPDRHNRDFVEEVGELEERCRGHFFKPTLDSHQRFERENYGPIREGVLLETLLRRSHLDPVKVLNAEVAQGRFRPEVVRTVAISIKYQGYIERAKSENAKVYRMAKKAINWKMLTENINISHECRQRIERHRPRTISDLRKIEGIRPATVAFVVGNAP